MEPVQEPADDRGGPRIDGDVPGHPVGSLTLRVLHMERHRFRSMSWSLTIRVSCGLMPVASGMIAETQDLSYWKSCTGIEANSNILS